MTTGEVQAYNQYLSQALDKASGFTMEGDWTEDLTLSDVSYAARQEAMWRVARDARREAQGSGQNRWDDLTQTSTLEEQAALGAIWRDRATYYAGGVACGTQMECFTGADFDYGYITLGHTVLSGARTSGGDYASRIRDETQAHELQHVLDVEYLGSARFYAEYGGWSVFGAGEGFVETGQFPWHDNSYMEYRAFEAESNFSVTQQLPGRDAGAELRNTLCRAIGGFTRGLPPVANSWPWTAEQASRPLRGGSCG